MTKAAYQTEGTTSETTQHVWEIAKSTRVCMLTTWDGKAQRSRPMSSHVLKDDHAIYFLYKEDSEKEKQIAAFPECSLNYVDPGKNTYLTITGTSSSSNDRAKIKELWSNFYKVWFDSENDPSLRLITFEPKSAEIWEGPNAIVATGIMLYAAATGAKPEMGKNAKVAM